MEIENQTEAIAASFDIVSRQDEAEKAITALRGDVTEVKSRFDRVSRAASRPAIAGACRNETEVKGFIDGYLRRGSETEIKSLAGSVPKDGGYVVPREVYTMIATEVKEFSPIRQLAQVVQVGSAGYRKLVATGGTSSSWVGETVSRPETDTPEFAEIAPPTGELYANPAASQAMLDDAAFDVESWLATGIAMEFARAEGAAFINGTGVDQPLGFLTAPFSSAADTTRPFGTLQYIASGEADDLGVSPELRLIDLVHTMKASYRQGASWVMNASTLAEVRKLKTADGAFLW